MRNLNFQTIMVNSLFLIIFEDNSSVVFFMVGGLILLLFYIIQTFIDGRIKLTKKYLIQTLVKSRIRLPEKFLMQTECLSQVILILRKIIAVPSPYIEIDFSRVEKMTEGTYMVLLAQIEKANKKGKKIWLYPRLPDSRAILNLIIKKKNYTHADIEVTPEMKLYINDATKDQQIDTAFVDSVVSDLRRIGIREYYQPFYDLLIEIIGNATEHGIQNQNINWWMHKYRDYSAQCIHYVFVDMGLGIIESYKRVGLLKEYSHRDKMKILSDALHGKLGSSTKECGRGRGLPQIRDAVEKGFISDFVLITNSVSLCYTNKEFAVSTNPDFVGTYFSWTINKANYYTWKNSQ